MDSWLCCFLDEGLQISYLSALPFLSCKMGIPFSMDYGNETQGELGYVSPIRRVQFQRGCSRDLKLSLPLHSRGQVWSPGSGEWNGRDLESISAAQGDSPCWAGALSQLPCGTVGPVLLDHNSKVC